MNTGNERLMAILIALRKLPRWALILITVGVIIILGIAMFLLLPQESPTTGDASYINSTGLAFSIFLKLGVVVLLIAGLAIILRRMQTKVQGIKTKQVEVLETVHLSPHRTLYLLNIENKKILIGATDQSMNTLYQFTNNGQLQQTDTTQNFAELLDQANNSSDE